MITKPNLNKSKEEYSVIINKIKSDSAVGIDVQLTHAIIIDYLQDISTRLEKLEQKINND